MLFSRQSDYADLSDTWKRGLRRIAASHTKLLPFELAWRDKQIFLEARGYRLRPRYHPAWVPSWDLPENAQCYPSSFEDFITPPIRRHLIDATRTEDGRLVYIKRVGTNSDELRIARLLSAEHLVTEAQNHCVPILDSFSDDVNPSISYIVMPFLRPVDEPPFETVADVIDFVGQVLEGIVFMHDQGVAHRDCAYRNIMMDADALFPHGYHPIRLSHDPTGQHEVLPLPRSTHSIRYYYVDFGLSVHILPGQPRSVLGGHGQDQDAPELSFSIPYDPFKLDIFILGNMLKTMFYGEYRNVNFLLPLIQAMTQPEPSQRPEARLAEAMWRELKAEVTVFEQSWRLKSRKEFWPQTLALDGWNLLGQGARAGKRFFSWVNDSQG